MSEKKPKPSAVPESSASKGDRRRAKRVPTAGPMMVRLLQQFVPTGHAVLFRGKEENRWLEGTLRDLSMTGVGIKCDRLYDVGSIVHVRISFSKTEKPYEVFGKVVWAKDGAMGVKFVKVDPSSIPSD